MDTFVIDFETYYSASYSLRKMTTAEYVFSPEFQTIGVGIRWPDGSLRWLEHDEFLEDQALREWIANSAVLAHHAHFDGLILAHHYGILPAFWVDTLSMARPIHGIDVGRSLDKLSKHYSIGVKGTEVVQALGKRREHFTLAEWLQYGNYCMNDCKLEWDLLGKLIVDFPEQELAVIDQTVRMFTEPVVQLDEPRMAAYYESEVIRKRALLESLNQSRETIMSNDKFAAYLMSLGIEPPKKWSAKKKKMDWAFAKKDPAFEALKQFEDPHDPIREETVRTAIEVRLGIKSTINETRSARILSLGKGGRAMPIYLSFCGAHTTRFTGGDKMNWQNFERPDKKNPNKGVIRRCIMAPKGHLIVAADSGQIEARGTAWLAEEQDLVEDFAAGVDTYCKFASTAYRREITKKDEKERAAGKQCVLGLGYSMGWSKLTIEMLKGPMGAPPVKFSADEAAMLGVDVYKFLDKVGGTEEALRDRVVSILSFEELLPHAAVCDYLVRTYRQKNTKITRFWWDVCPQIIRSMVDGDPIDLGPFRIEKERIRLPSGLYLRYPDLQVDDGGNASYWNGKHRVSMHGGLVTENLIQAMCRVVITEQMLEVAKQGHKIVTTTHDEIVLCVPEQEAKAVLAELIRIMKTPPAWAPGLPLAAEGGIAQRYGDAK